MSSGSSNPLLRPMEAFHDWLLAGQADHVETEAGKSVLRYTRRARLFFAFATIITLGASLIPMVFVPNLQAKLLISAMIGWMPLLGLVFTLETWICTIRFNDYQLCVRSPWRGYREIPWQDVTEVSYSSMLSLHRIETRSYGTVGVSDVLAGTTVLVREARQRLIARQLHQNEPLEAAA